MQILLACVKIMNDRTEVVTPAVSEPKFLKDAEHFALLMSQRSEASGKAERNLKNI